MQTASSRSKIAGFTLKEKEGKKSLQRRGTRRNLKKGSITMSELYFSWNKVRQKLTEYKMKPDKSLTTTISCRLQGLYTIKLKNEEHRSFSGEGKAAH